MANSCRSALSGSNCQPPCMPTCTWMAQLGLAVAGRVASTDVTLTSKTHASVGVDICQASVTLNALG